MFVTRDSRVDDYTHNVDNPLAWEDDDHRLDGQGNIGSTNVYTAGDDRLRQPSHNNPDDDDNMSGPATRPWGPAFQQDRIPTGVDLLSIAPEQTMLSRLDGSYVTGQPRPFVVEQKWMYEEIEDDYPYGAQYDQ